MQDKNYLRKLYLNNRLELSPFEIENKSSQIVENLFSISKVKNKANFSIYLPINNEVNTKLIINQFLKQHKNIYCPYFSKIDEAYFFAKFANWKDLEEGPYGIFQPTNTKRIDTKLIEVALIPALAFSKDGTRLGYGKGVFDNLLSKSKALRIGLAYNFQVIDKLPKEKHDLVMDIVVTETKIYRF